MGLANLGTYSDVNYLMRRVRATLDLSTRGSTSGLRRTTHRLQLEAASCRSFDVFFYFEVHNTRARGQASDIDATEGSP